VWADRFFFQGADRNWGLALTQNIYTPDSLEAVSIQQYDRPYAGWLYGGFFLNSVNRACDKQMVVELDVGLLGNGLAGEVQSWWHGRCFIDAPVPKGWHNHVAGDLGLQLSLFGQTKLWGNRRDDPWADLWGFGKSEVGNVYFRPTLGGALRVGDFRRPPPTGPVPTRRNRATETGDSGERYVFFRADCKYVFHNGTMQGGKLFSRNAEPNHTVPVNRLVNTFEGGFHYSYGSYFVEWSLVQISPEIDLPGAPGAHKYWQIQVGDSDQHMCRKGYREIIAAFVAYLVLDQLDD